jgi:hypothetical protein
MEVLERKRRSLTRRSNSTTRSTGRAGPIWRSRALSSPRRWTSIKTYDIRRNASDLTLALRKQGVAANVARRSGWLVGIAPVGGPNLYSGDSTLALCSRVIGGVNSWSVDQRPS